MSGRLLRSLLLSSVVVASVVTPVAAAAAGAPVHFRGDDVVQARLSIASNDLSAGTTKTATVDLTPAPGWHLYGPEHGDAGQPPSIAWTLPRGVQARAIAWPPSRRVVEHGLTTYEYRGPVALRVPLAAAADAPQVVNGPVQADVSWLVCSNVCVPGHVTLTTHLTVTPPSAGIAASLAAYLGLAFLGGLILNLMPCVFPVLSFKALRAISEPYERRWRSAAAYVAGVTASCSVLGAALLAARAAGHAVGWGFQLQTPAFVAFLALLLLALGLAMSGVFELTVPVPAPLARRAAAAGSFGDGVLVSVIASACIAPYMGAALGFALSASAAAALGIFLALGLGLALPHALVTLVPRLLGWLPKPGQWTLVARRVLAVPLYVSTAWLAWVFVLEVIPSPAPASTMAAQTATTFTPAHLAQLRRHHGAVLVDVGAAWCITCKVNERFALDHPDVVRRLRDLHVTVLRADWTNQNPQITAYLRSFGAAGVPLYVYYARSGSVRVWPQVLTPGAIIDRLNRA